MSLNKSLEYARNLQEKYEFYLVALTYYFSLSIQTAKFGNNIYADIAEILAGSFYCPLECLFNEIRNAPCCI